MNIGIVIKEVRKQKGLTQLDLSEHADLSERTIQRIVIPQCSQVRFLVYI
jgi:transcriptional regulator with XRE-family HTH domain